MRFTITPAALFHICSTITPQSLPNCSPITPQLNYASVYPPSFDTLEWMEMHIDLPLSELMKLFHRAYSLPQRLQAHPDGSSVSTIFEDLFTEEGTGA